MRRKKTLKKIKMLQEKGAEIYVSGFIKYNGTRVFLDNEPLPDGEIGLYFKFPSDFKIKDDSKEFSIRVDAGPITSPFVYPRAKITAYGDTIQEADKNLIEIMEKYDF